VNVSLHNISAMNQPLLFEMIRSFTTLARTLNLSHSVAELNSTRQTVRRHISILEELRGAPLFHVVNRRYELTDAGYAALPEAQDLLLRGMAWARGQSGSTGDLQYLKASQGDWVFHQQQQPLGMIWKDESLLLRETFRASVMASGEIENSCLTHVRPFLLIYRYSDSGWICVEFGEKSAYVKWFGSDYAKSSIGRPIARLPAGEEFGHMLDQSFHDVESTQSARLDHVYTRMPERDGANQATIAYQRLMMAGSFPDGSPAVLALVVPTNNVVIKGLNSEHFAALTEISPPEFNPEDAWIDKIAKGAK